MSTYDNIAFVVGTIYDFTQHVYNSTIDTITDLLKIHKTQQNEVMLDDDINGNIQNVIENKNKNKKFRVLQEEWGLREVDNNDLSQSTYF